MSKAKIISLWVLRVFLGIAFVGAGAAKLAGAPTMVTVFTKIGIDPWLRILTGLIEIGSGICLFAPKLTRYAATLPGVTMLSAIAFHLTKLGGNPTAPVVLFPMSAAVVWFTGPKTSEAV